ncbi:hypothetical protein HDU84_000727, partial [Entophlyctis sp. JEL0112]
RQLPTPTTARGQCGTPANAVAAAPETFATISTIAKPNQLLTHEKYLLRDAARIVTPLEPPKLFAV